MAILVLFTLYKLNAATNLIYGVKQSRSEISSISSSDESIEDNEPPAKRRILVCMPRSSFDVPAVKYFCASIAQETATKVSMKQGEFIHV
ncbi:hypothetical protein NPIL_544631 [Nephila pilipes]|uniref:Uncharacterized protein n=1 Tax=Nephila pilipes TaxID=299642 RepID=A0A8X6U3I9_NEPPI|nr:hypothetical protein NPIL_544631 [Nephila pilipes]